jgi:pimeloyl-ACP methyl ester carboxylesterase
VARAKALAMLIQPGVQIVFMPRILSVPPFRSPLKHAPWVGLVAALVKLCLLMLVAAVLLLSGGCAWLADKQSQLALRPTPTDPSRLPPASELFGPGDERWLQPVPPTRAAHTRGPAPTAPDQLALWWLPAKAAGGTAALAPVPAPASAAASADGAPALLYLHGTFRNLYQNLPKINALRAAGFDVLAVDYRGWGDSSAIVPDEETIAADARVAWAELQRRVPQAHRRFIFGHSMGGAVAVRLASTQQWPADYAGLMVESSFTRMPEVAGEAGFWGRVAARLTTLEFDAIGRIAQVQAPILLVHGSADRTVPVVLGRRLRDAALARGPAASPVQWVEFEGGSHSHLHREFPEAYVRAYRDFVQKH